MGRALLLLIVLLLAGCDLGTLAPTVAPPTLPLPTPTPPDGTAYDTPYLSAQLPGREWTSGQRQEPFSGEVLYTTVPARLFLWSVTFPDTPLTLADLSYLAKDFVLVQDATDVAHTTAQDYLGYSAIRVDTPVHIKGLPTFRAIVYFVAAPGKTFTIGAGGRCQ